MDKLETNTRNYDFAIVLLFLY